jgi:hypothetical protein
MNIYRLLLTTTALSIALAGCDKGSEPKPSEALETQQPAAGGPVAGQEVPDAATVPKPVRKNQKLVLETGHAVSGDVTVKKAAKLTAISAFIGTFSNRPEAERSDGTLKMKACVASDCAEASIDLSNAQDNALQVFTFDRPLPTISGSVINYSLEKTTGLNPVVVWTYPAASGSPTIAHDGVAMDGRSPKLELSYAEQ